MGKSKQGADAVKNGLKFENKIKLSESLF